MPYDATNMPFRRSHSYINDNASFTEGIDLELDTALKAESILLEEFNYASLTAYQLKEGRSGLFNLYLLIVGITATGLGTIATLYSSLKEIIGFQYSYATGYKETIPIYGPPKELYILAIVVLLIISILSILFFIRFIYMSLKYKDCLLVIEKIKDFYLYRLSLSMPGLKDAFHWRLNTIPTVGSLGSFMSLVGIFVAIVGCIYFEGFIVLLIIFLFQPENGYFTNLGKIEIAIAIVVTALIWLRWHWRYYLKQLKIKMIKKSKNKMPATEVQA